MNTKKIFFTALLAGLCGMAFAQTVKVHEKTGTVVYNALAVDSITFSENSELPANRSHATTVNIDAHWCALGTSITFLNTYEKYDRFKSGYLDRVMTKLNFSKLTNQAVSGGCIISALDKVIKADYYTIEHGINDWGHVIDANHVAVGDFEEDYINKKNKNTFAYYYRMLIDLIFSTNPYAKVVLCTPRKAYGFGTYLPAHWYDPMIDENGKEVYLEDYANLIRKIAEYESFPLCDWFAEAGGQRNLAKYSIDEALHPNDTGHQIMANLLVEAFMKTIIPPTK